MINNYNFKIYKSIPVVVGFWIYLTDGVIVLWVMYDFYNNSNNNKIYLQYSSHQERLKKIKHYSEEYL